MTMPNKRTGRRETLCSTCGNACNAGCSWSDVFDPVPGWVAVRTLNSYYVLDCPEYISDALTRPSAQDLDTEGCILLLEAVMGQMKEDYLNIRMARRGIERFIMNPAMKHLFFFAVPGDIVARLRKEADEHDRKAAESVKP